MMAAEEAVAAKGTVTWRLAAMAAAARRRQYDDGGATATASISWGDKGHSAKEVASKRLDLGVGRRQRGNSGGSSGPAAAMYVAVVGSSDGAGVGS